jgi:tetratricopeptide (TPR) repeat protein
MTHVNPLVRRCRVLLITLAVFVGVAADATAQSTPGSRVLVMPFAAEVDAGAPGGGGAALWLGEAASSLIVEGLATRGVGAMTREERVTAFERLNLPMTSALTRATTIRVGELIGASEVVFGEVRLGERLEIRARLVRLSTGNELTAVEHQGALPDIFQVFDVVADRIAGQTGRFRPARPAPPPLGLETFESYLKGLVAATPAAQQRFLEAAVRQAPTDPRILMALWDVYTAQGDHERAIASANAVSPDASAYRQARFAVALSMLELRRFDGAWQALTTIYNAERAAAVSSLLGVVQLRRGAAPGGNPPTTYFKRAVDEHPENTDYLFNLGYAHALAGNATEALTWLREVVRFDAADGDAHRVMSALLAAAGRTTEAQRELELARLLGGTDDEVATFVLSPQVPQGLERIPAAADLSTTTVLRTVVGAPAQRDQEATARFHLTNARALLAEGRDRDAISELRRAVYLSPYEEEPHRLLGGVHQRAGRLVEAIEEFTVALWCRETAAGRVALGAALLENGQREAAQREAARALVLEPGSVEARALAERASP